MINCILLKESFQRTNFKKRWSPIQWFAVFRSRETSLGNSFVFFSRFSNTSSNNIFMHEDLYLCIDPARNELCENDWKTFLLFRRKCWTKTQQLVAWKIDVGSGKNRKYNSNLQELHLSNNHIRTRHDLRVIICSFWEKIFIVAMY